jgi:hypothetical protein
MRLTRSGLIACIALLITQPAFSDGWWESDSHDPLTGRVQKEYATPGQTLSEWDGTTGHLRLRCQDNEFQAFVLFNRFFSLQDGYWYWFDQGKVIGPMSAVSAASGQASFLKDEADVRKLMRLFTQPEVRVKIRAGGGSNEIVLKFDTDRATEFIERAAAECKTKF